MTNYMEGVRVPDPGQTLVEVPERIGEQLRNWTVTEAAVKKFQDRAAKARAAYAEAKQILDAAEEQLRSARENARFARAALIATIEEHQQ